MITVAAGPNTYMRDALVADMVTAYKTRHGDLNFELLDGSEATHEAIIAACTTLPFLADARMVVVKQFTACKQLLEAVEAFVAVVHALPTDVLLIDDKLDKRTSWYKVLQKQTKLHDFQPLDARGVEQWLVAEASSRGGKISSADARLLIARVGEDQQLLSHELSKLLTYNPAITKQTIELLCDPLPQSTIFMMVEALFSGDIQKALLLYDDQRHQRVEPQAIMGMVVWQMHMVALAKTAGSRSAQEIAKQAGVSPFALQKSQGLASRLSLRDIKRLFAYLTEADLRTKTESVDADRLMQTALIHIATTVAG